VIIAIPLAIVGIGVIALIDITRRRRQAQQVHDFREEAKTKDVDFTERDKETLVSE
jgi:hypothetical protein